MTQDWLPTHMGHSQELEEAYQDFWVRFKKLATKVIIGPSKLKLEFNASDECLIVDVARQDPIRFCVPAAESSHVEKLDVFVAGSQIVRKARAASTDREVWITVKSEYDILYLDALEKANAAKAWRDRVRASACAGYQLVVETGDHCRQHFADAALKFSLTRIQEETIRRWYRQERDAWFHAPIPSAPLDLVGLLYVILHQHERSGIVGGWPSSMGTVLSKLPMFRFARDQRSFYGHWFEHSHVTLPEPSEDSAARVVDGFSIQSELKKAGWGARIRGLESREDPHLSINRGDEYRRLNLRTGKMMDGDESWIPEALRAEIDRTWDAWKALWNYFYDKDNPV